MKVTKVKVTDLIYAMEKFLESGTDYVDIELLSSKNTIKFSTSVFEEGETTEILSA